MREQSIEAIARSYSRQYIEVMRAKAFVMYQEGSKPSEIAMTLRFNEAIIRNWLHRFNECGIAGLHNRRPLTQQQRRKLSLEQLKLL